MKLTVTCIFKQKDRNLKDTTYVFKRWRYLYQNFLEKSERNKSTKSITLGLRGLKS